MTSLNFNELFSGLSPEVNLNLLSTVVLIAVVLVGRFIAVRTVRRWRFNTSEMRRRWIFMVKNVFVIIIFLGLIVIWAEELRTVAISLVAVAVALVIGTKELIVCFLGGVYRISGRLFDIGDRIEIGDYSGDVIDHNMFVTTLFEIGPLRKGHQYTGRMISVPNSLFLNHAVFNESATDHYSLHLFTVPLKVGEDWKGARKLLLRLANEKCQPFIDAARAHLDRMSIKEGFESPDSRPRVNVHFASAEELEFMIRIPVPSSNRGKVEQAIKQGFLNEFKYTDITTGQHQ